MQTDQKEFFPQSYNHICFPKTLGNSHHATDERVYWDCVETKENSELLFLRCKINDSKLHWVVVAICPFCDYKPTQTK